MPIDASVGRKPKPKAELLSAMFPPFRCTKAELRALQAAAEKAGVAPATWAREILLSAAGVQRVADPVVEAVRLLMKAKKLLEG